MESLSEVTDVMVILRQWEEEHSQFNYDPVPTLTRLAEIIEAETENYMKMDPDPFDERHPSRADPDCALGHILKVLFRKDNFMNKLVNDYLRDNYWARTGNPGKDSRKLTVAVCRLILDIMPGLETSAVFQQPEMESTVLRLFSWAEKSSEPLQSYATGMLAAAMEVQDIAANFREQNSKLVPLMLQRLHKLQARAMEERQQVGIVQRPFAHLGSLGNDVDAKKPVTASCSSSSSLRSKKRSIEGRHKENGGFKHRSPLSSPPPVPVGSPPLSEPTLEAEASQVNGVVSSPGRTCGIKRFKELEDELLELSSVEGTNCSTPARDSAVMSPPPVSLLKHSPSSGINSIAGSTTSECSNSSWAEMESYVIGNIQIYPPTLATRQMLILRYLTPMGEYQEFLGHAFEHNALELILRYTNLKESKDSRLAFEALKYLAALLCHKKFSIEFINMKGLQTLLDVPRPSVAATGVSICLYYLAYCEDAMERVCQLPHHLISELVRYALWLLECSHDSGRCHATMFFGLSFQFRVILQAFDAEDGLRKLYNLISTLPILSVDDETILNDDEENAARQIVRHVCVAIKRYLEAHLCIKAESLRRSQFRDTCGQLESSSLPAKLKSSPEDVREQIQTLFDYMPFRSHWEAVEQLMRLGGITLLLQIIAFAYEWNSSGGRISAGSAETVRCALDALSICSVMPRVQLLLCDRVDLPDDAMTVGTNIILGAAEGEIVVDPEAQRAALNVIINCVCAPIHRVGGTVARFSATGSAKKKTSFKTSEELIQKVWESIRTNNGIMVLLQLMMIKTPITDADSIRALACRALAGLARSETVRQIISKLPLFTSGQLQLLMRDPILQDKRQEHVVFQKYALELLERVSGKTKPVGNELEVSLANMHRASVVAQTRIQFNDKQLYQLIHQHLLARGLTESAAVLHREANLPGPAWKCAPLTSNLPVLPFYRVNASSPVPARPRLTSYSPSTPTSHHRQSNSLSSSTPKSSLSLTAATTSASCSLFPSIASSTQPIRLNLASSRREKASMSGIGGAASRSLQKQTSWEAGSTLNSPLLKPSVGSAESRVTLDSIITEYLTNQHALCKNPVAPCPQFNLFEPHKCPDPNPKNSAPLNFTMRMQQRALSITGLDGLRLDRRMVHSRFCPVRTFRLTDEDGFFTCCEFLQPTDQYLMMGTHHGEVKMFNIHTGAEEATYQCHDSGVSNLATSRDGQLLLTSCPWQRPLSALWSIKFFEMKFPLPDEEYVEFSNLTEDRIIGTKGQIATIYDTATGKKLQTLSPSISNQYTKNRATFSPTDELVLSDGVLWDVNAGKEIHKLDKLNQTLSGVFHPNGLEVVCNTEVWDLRTFHLLRTVPVLDQCEVMFSPNGSVIYTVSLEQDSEEDLPFESSFKTLDAYDYSSIATIDVRRNIFDLTCNKYDTQIAIVENNGLLDNVQESSVRLYDVGRRREYEDEGDDEDDDEDMDHSDDASASSSASDNEQQDDAAAGEGGANNEEQGERENGGNRDDDYESLLSDSDDARLVSLSDSDEIEDILYI
ncbi:hypothetical protein R5R35_008241 [Gryllus longicercus]|uniref:DDB1- and CUL4-associated factor 1 n=1 Tax=Gryllus longicercus TaxID=2509291 RepID=A0AAN9W2D4_9ORTH